jgi:hypothetical protein
MSLLQTLVMIFFCYVDDGMDSFLMLYFINCHTKAVLWSRSREAEIKCHQEPELKIRIAAPPAPLSIYHKLEDILKQKSWLLKKFLEIVPILSYYFRQKKVTGAERNIFGSTTTLSKRRARDGIEEVRTGKKNARK